MTKSFGHILAFFAANWMFLHPSTELQAFVPNEEFFDAQQKDEMMIDEIQLHVLTGKEIHRYMTEIANLRIIFFREFPYLYEGDSSQEENYLAMYSSSENTVVVIAKDADQIVGVVAGLPLDESTEEIKQIDGMEQITGDIFYLGEIVVLEDERKDNIKRNLYREFENQIREKESYKRIFVCEIDRPASDPRKPPNYIPSDYFWSAEGFVKQPELTANFSWKELDRPKEENHLMIFWVKNLL